MYTGSFHVILRLTPRMAAVKGDIVASVYRFVADLGLVSSFSIIAEPGVLHQSAVDFFQGLFFG